MASPSVTYTFLNGQTSDGPQVSQNFTDLISSLTDSTKDIAVALISGSTITATSNFRSAGGSFTAPAFSFSSNTNYGIYYSGGVNFSCAGAKVGGYNTAGAWTIGASGGVQDITINGISLTLQGTNAGTLLYTETKNNSNTASSTAAYFATVAGTSAGNAFYCAKATGGQSWAWGLAQSDSNKFKITNNTVITGSGEYFSITTAGAVMLQSGTATKLILNNLLATNGAATMTLTNGPAAATSGNPVGWLQITVNGMDRYLPFW